MPSLALGAALQVYMTPHDGLTHSNPSHDACSATAICLSSCSTICLIDQLNCLWEDLAGLSFWGCLGLRDPRWSNLKRPILTVNMPAVQDHYSTLFMPLQLHLHDRMIGLFWNCLREELAGFGFEAA
jgi:hypothetical protein